MISDISRKSPNLWHLPEDWKISHADSLCSKITKGTTPPKSEITADKTIPFVRVNNLRTDGGIGVKANLIFVTKKAHSTLLARSIAFPGDILMNIVGPPLGQTIVLDNQYLEYNMNQAVLIYRPIPEKINRDFFYYYLISEHSQEWLQSRAKKTSGQQNLTIALCKELPVPIPPITEQKKIAQIISSWSKAIEIAENLIQNSKTKKNALMQKLLTGKNRFSEFSGTWEKIPLSKLISEVKRPVVWDDNTQYSLLSVKRRSEGIILREKLYGHQILTKNMSTVESGDFLISKMQVVHGAMALVSKKFHKHHISGSYICLRAKDPGKIDMEFFSWYCKQKIMYHKAFLCSYGVHIEKMTFDFPLFLHVEIEIPPSIKEQRMIVCALDAAENEVFIHQEKLALLKQEKKSLMQKLLTGKVRVRLKEQE